MAPKTSGKNIKRVRPKSSTTEKAKKPTYVPQMASWKAAIVAGKNVEHLLAKPIAEADLDDGAEMKEMAVKFQAINNEILIHDRNPLKKSYENSKQKIIDIANEFDNDFCNGKLFSNNNRLNGVIYVTDREFDAFNSQYLYTLTKRGYPQITSGKSKTFSTKLTPKWQGDWGVTYRFKAPVSKNKSEKFFVVLISTEALKIQRELEDTVRHELCHAKLYLDGDNTDPGNECGGHSFAFAKLLLDVSKFYGAFEFCNAGPVVTADHGAATFKEIKIKYNCNEEDGGLQRIWSDIKGFYKHIKKAIVFDENLMIVKIQ